MYKSQAKVKCISHEVNVNLTPKLCGLEAPAADVTMTLKQFTAAAISVRRPVLSDVQIFNIAGDSPHQEAS